MAYADPAREKVSETAVINPVVDYHDRVRWGPIFAGIVVAIATQLILSALGAAIGLSTGVVSTEPSEISLGVGIWSIISLLIALFIGGWVTAATCGPMNSKTALLHGLILWATTLAISSWLLANGVSGTFGIVASNAGEVLGQVQDVSAAQAREAAEVSAAIAWSFIVGSLLSLAASLIGASVGARKPRAKVRA